VNIIATLRQKIAPELNHLYTVPPFTAVDGGSDCGWYCREHALHVLFVASLFGATCDVRHGDFLVCAPPHILVTSIDSGAGHTWCSVNGVTPVDLSITFRFFGPGPQLLAPVSGRGRNGPYTIVYSDNDEAARACQQPGTLHYVEREVHQLSLRDLVSDPYGLIYAPIVDDAQSWHRIYGPQIYAKISLHCYRIATRQVKPLHRSLNPIEAARWISEHYPNASNDLSALLERNR
jgi:hypothetical protein